VRLAGDAPETRRLALQWIRGQAQSTSRRSTRWAQEDNLTRSLLILIGEVGLPTSRMWISDVRALRAGQARLRHSPDGKVDALGDSCIDGRIQGVARPLGRRFPGRNPFLGVFEEHLVIAREPAKKLDKIV
jgi:hypothetical protein